MDRTSAIAALLKERYGIETQKQLDDALSKLGLLDISIFRAEPEKGEKK